ncbi:hypothetical protein BAC3_02387 [uncultured bacterium]|nr:hypothetical protein BAC3_02387 [uncultured bacterium]
MRLLLSITIIMLFLVGCASKTQPAISSNTQYYGQHLSEGSGGSYRDSSTSTTENRVPTCEEKNQAKMMFKGVNKVSDNMMKSEYIGDKLYGGMLKLMYGAMPTAIEKGNPDCK